MTDTSQSAPVDRLVIPLTNALKKLQSQSRLGGGYLWIIFFFGIFLPYLAISGYFAVHHISEPLLKIALCAITFIVTISITIGNIRQAGDTLRQYEMGHLPSLTLNSEGMEVPILLLLATDPNRRELLALGKSVIRILWQDILVWEVWNEHGGRGGGIQAGYYLTTTEGAILPSNNRSFIGKNNKLLLHRDWFSEEEEENILDFARRFEVAVVGPNFFH